MPARASANAACAAGMPASASAMAARAAGRCASACAIWARAAGRRDCASARRACASSSATCDVPGSISHRSSPSSTKAPLRKGAETILPLVSARTSTWRRACVSPRSTIRLSTSRATERMAMTRTAPSTASAVSSVGASAASGGGSEGASSPAGAASGAIGAARPAKSRSRSRSSTSPYSAAPTATAVTIGKIRILSFHIQCAACPAAKNSWIDRCGNPPGRVLNRSVQFT